MSEMPFGFTWCYEDGQCQVLVLGEPEDVPSLDIGISNILTDHNILISPIDGVYQANQSNYHFKLTFAPGVLVDPSAIDVESADWSISYTADNVNGDSIYLLWTGLPTLLLPETRGTEKKMTVVLSGVAAQSARTKSTTTNVNISWVFDPAIQVVSPERIPETGDYYDNTTLALELVQSTGESDLPLYVGFVDCNKVININEQSNSLQLRLTNTKLPSEENSDITFHYGSDINLASQLVVTLEVGTDEARPWALGLEDQVNKIAISFPGGQWEQNGDIETIKMGEGEEEETRALRWTFLPQSGDVVLAAQETMLIKLDNIKTSHTTGETNLYLSYQYVPGYKDGQFVCQIEKAPLTFDNKVRMGTRHELNGLLTVQDGISLDDRGDIQHEHGYLNFGSTIRQMINLYQYAYGIGVQAYTAYFRSPKNFAWHKGGSHNDNELNPGGGTVDMVLKDGSLGVGTSDPSYKLDVNGTAHLGGDTDITGSLKVGGRIQDKTGYVIPVGTIVPYGGSSAPEGWLMCHGGSLVGSKYDELRAVLGKDTVPNLQNQFIVGVGSDYDLNKTGGAKQVTLKVSEMPEHNHAPDTTYKYLLKINNQCTTDKNNSTSSEPNLCSAEAIVSAGGGQPHENRPPYYALNYIIKY